MSAATTYGLVTVAYWGFTVTDGALRMLVLLHFHGLGYQPAQLAFLFLLYELCGVVTNLLGGWIGARLGLRLTLLCGIALQVAALLALSALRSDWSEVASVAYVMGAQAASGVAKDLTKMSSKSAIKVLVQGREDSLLFRWVAVLTGSKNALKGAGFFVGGVLLVQLGFAGGLRVMAVLLAGLVVALGLTLPSGLGVAKSKSQLKHVLSKSPAFNRLSLARLFLFGARDTWFVVGVPVYLAADLGWGLERVGAFLALWVIGYGAVQSLTPWLLRRWTQTPGAAAARTLAAAMAVLVVLLALGFSLGWARGAVLLGGLGLFGLVFALNSSVHSYLVLAYSTAKAVSLDVGFYYMANAAGRLLGTLASGVSYQLGGVGACLWCSAVFTVLTYGISHFLPDAPQRAIAGAG